MKQFEIKPNDTNQRLDKFLQKAVPNLPKSLMYKYIRLKRIKVNRKKSDISYILQEGDLLDCYISDEFFETGGNTFEFLSAPAVVSVIYEDKNIILLDKKPGLVVHADDQNTTDTLINRLLHYLYRQGEYNPDNELSFAPALVNRIDRNTSGIVIAAKNAEALRILNEKIKNREVSKFYLCIALGQFNQKEATLKAYLKKDENKKLVTVRDTHFTGSKEIVTKYKILREKADLSLLEVELITGRTHQIRAHMAYIGHPLLGDGKYGKNENNKKYKFKVQALCAYKLRFDFTTDANILNYLNKKEFKVPDVWFFKYIDI